MRRAAAGLVALLGIWGCRGSARPTPTPAPLPVRSSIRVAPDTNVRRVFDFGRRHGSSRASLQLELGAPVRVTVEETPNRHGAGTDSIFRLDYGGIVFWVRRASSGPELLEHAELLDGRRLVGTDVVVGRTTTKQLRARLGAPRSREVRADTLMLTYRAPGDGVDEFLRFDLVKGVVRRIVWIFYVD